METQMRSMGKLPLHCSDANRPGLGCLPGVVSAPKAAARGRPDCNPRSEPQIGLMPVREDAMKAYLVLDLSVNDFGRFRKYIDEIPALIAIHSGKFIVQGVQPTPIEGDWKPDRMVILEFPHRDQAEAFLADPEIRDLFRLRHETTTSRLVLADGGP